MILGPHLNPPSIQLKSISSSVTLLYFNYISFWGYFFIEKEKSVHNAKR